VKGSLKTVKVDGGNGGGEIIKKFDIFLLAKIFILQSKYSNGKWSLIFVLRVFSSKNAIIRK